MNAPRFILGHSGGIHFNSCSCEVIIAVVVEVVVLQLKFNFVLENSWGGGGEITLGGGGGVGGYPRFPPPYEPLLVDIVRLGLICLQRESEHSKLESLLSCSHAEATPGLHHHVILHI